MTLHLKYILLIIVLTFTIYFGVLQNGFVWDDRIEILNNDLIKDLSLNRIIDAFVPGKTSNAVYTPSGEIFHKIYYYLWKTDPFWYHLIILIYFILNLILIYFIVLELFHKENLAFLTALFFLIHPVHVEAVAWIGCGTYVLASLFLLLSFYLFIKFIEKKYSIFFILSILFFIFSLLTHHFPVVFPLLLLLYLYCFSKNTFKSYIILLLPYCILTLIDVYLSLNVGYEGGRVGYNYHHTPLIQIFNIFGKYLFNIFIPLELSPKYFYPLSNFYSIICILLLIAIAVFIYITKSKDYFFCWAWFFICLLPFSHIIPLAWKMADRYLFFASLGFCLFLALICEKILNKKILQILIILLAIFCSVITVNMTAIWKDELSLWKYTEKKAPESTLVIKNLALSYLDAGLLDDSLFYFKKLDDKCSSGQMAIDYEVYSYTGLIEFRKGNYEEAIKNYMTAIRINPDSSELYRSLAVVYYTKGDVRLCVKNYMIARSFNKRTFKLFPSSLGLLYHNMGHLEMAIIYYKHALMVNSDDEDIRNLLYIAYLEKFLLAKGEYTSENLAAVMKKTNDMNEIALQYLSSSDFDRGEATMKNTLLLNPFSFEASYNLGLLYYNKGNFKESLCYFRKALHIYPASKEAGHYITELSGKTKE